MASSGNTSVSAPPAPFGVYIHVPFCERRCGYCAFNTVAVGARLERDAADRYVAAAVAEIAAAAEQLGRPAGSAVSVYFGGGTPTMLDPGDIARIVDASATHLGLSADCEITIESNPDGLREGQLGELRSLGIDRVSFGMQSIRSRVLALLDRTHDPQRALDAVAEAHGVGFAHVSVDLIHGTPGETAADWDATLDAVIDSGVDHVSAYALTIEAGTKLAARVRSGALDQPVDDDAADRYLVAHDRLSAAGLHWYELSNWAATNAARSRHNLLYWRGANWLGVGPGAHSHIDGVRWNNLASTDAWATRVLRGEPGCEDRSVEVLDASQRRLERIMLGLRLAEGLPLEALDGPDHHGAAGERAQPRLDRLVRDGLVSVDHDRITLTLQGRLLADAVVRSLI